MVARMTLSALLARAAIAAARMALIALALAVMAVPGPTRAEPKKQAPAQEQLPPEPSPAAMKLAREILDLKNTTAIFEPMVPGVIERIRVMHLQTNPNLAKPLGEVALQLRKAFAARTEELLADISWLYASRFTEAELKEIAAFYRSPTGKKVIEFEPRVFDDAMAGLKVWQEKFGEEVLARFRVEMKKRGHNL
jgi:hypothetical protein